MYCATNQGSEEIRAVTSFSAETNTIALEFFTSCTILVLVEKLCMLCEWP